MNILIGKKIYRLSLTFAIVSAICLSGCNNGNSTQEITVHFSAFSPSGHIQAKIFINGDKRIFTATDGDSALNFDISATKGKKVDAIFEGLSNSNLSAYASIKGVVAARQVAPPTPGKIAVVEMQFTSN